MTSCVGTVEGREADSGCIEDTPSIPQGGPWMSHFDHPPQFWPVRCHSPHVHPRQPHPRLPSQRLPPPLPLTSRRGRPRAFSSEPSLAFDTYLVVFKTHSEPYRSIDDFGDLTGQHCLVEGDRGHDLGEVREKIHVPAWRARQSILRPATDEEVLQLIPKRAAEDQAQRVCQTIADEFRLNITITDCEYQFDRQKATFLFENENNTRVDFRVMVAALFKILHMRVWLEQRPFGNSASRRKAMELLQRRKSVTSDTDSIEAVPPISCAPFIMSTMGEDGSGGSNDSLLAAATAPSPREDTREADIVSPLPTITSPRGSRARKLSDGSSGSGHTAITVGGFGGGWGQEVERLMNVLSLRSSITPPESPTPILDLEAPYPGVGNYAFRRVVSLPSLPRRPPGL